MIAEFTYSPKTHLCQVKLDNESVFDRLRLDFSVPNEGKKFAKGPYARFVSDRTYFITATGQMGFGIAEMVIEWLQKHVHELTVEYKFDDQFKERFKKDNSEYPFIDNLKLSPRDYQREAISLALKHHFGTFVMGTGAGKTLTIASILNQLFHYKKIKKALILVPDNGLVTQFEDELKNQYGLEKKISLFYDKYNKIDPEADITIANRPLFMSRFAVNEKFFKNTIDCLIVDEAHSIKRSNKVSKLLEKMNAHYRFGFTGTLAENKEDKMKNLGILGAVRYTITSKELRDEGFLTDVTAHNVILHYPERYAMENYREEIEFLQTYNARNEFLKKLMFKLKNNSLILVNYLVHGFVLEELFNSYNNTLPDGQKKQVFFIRGEVENEERDEVKKLMEKDDNVICIAITKIFSTGINIKNLHHVVLAAGGKSSVTVVQSIGRGLRLHPNKKELHIWDISDSGYKYSQNHNKKRLQIYNTEKIKTVEHNIAIKGDTH